MRLIVIVSAPGIKYDYEQDSFLSFGPLEVCVERAFSLWQENGYLSEKKRDDLFLAILGGKGAKNREEKYYSAGELIRSHFLSLGLPEERLWVFDGEGLDYNVAALYLIIRRLNAVDGKLEMKVDTVEQGVVVETYYYGKVEEVVV